MNVTEIDITSLLKSEDFVPFDLSNNRATLGDNAGELTWNASKEAAVAVRPPLLDSPERIEAWKDFVQSSGGWTREEIDAWDDTELNALLLQWIAGDIREAFDDADLSEWDWEEYQKDSEAGRISSTLYRTEDGRIFFSFAQ